MASKDATELVARLERIKKLAAELTTKLTDSRKAQAVARRIERELVRAIERRRPMS